MAYLVYCPTCSGRMSVNAETCPHCGETDFFVERQTPYVIKTVCMHCYGQGTVWTHTLYGGSEYNPRFSAKENDVVWQFRRLNGRAVVFRDVAPALRKTLERCLMFGDYELEIGKGPLAPVDIKFLEDICPKCKGEGKVDESGMGVKRVDIRKPVE